MQGKGYLGIVLNESLIVGGWVRFNVPMSGNNMINEGCRLTCKFTLFVLEGQCGQSGELIILSSRYGRQIRHFKPAKTASMKY